MQDVSYSQNQFKEMVDSIFDEIDLLGKWCTSENDSPPVNLDDQDFKLNFHKGRILESIAYPCIPSDTSWL